MPHSTTRLPGGLSFRLQNARSGEAYSHRLQPVPDAPHGLVFDRIDLPPALGLSADTASGLLHGTPGAAGQYQLTVHYHLAGQPARQLRAELVLLVVADPRSMWKNLPSDASAPYWRPDQQCSALHSGGWRALGASKRGRSHAHAGQFRDDDYRLAQVASGGWQIAVVADGAGSAAYSRRGAELICAAASACLEQALAGASGQHLAQAASALQAGTGSGDALQAALCAVLGDAARHACAALQAECGGPLAVERKDFSSTALIALCRRFDFGTLCAAFQVGDGTVAAYSKASGVTLLGAPDAGEYAGETRFLSEEALTPAALAARVNFTLADDVTALLLMSDGVAEPLFDSDAALASHDEWHAFWRRLEQEAGLAQVQAPGTEEKLLSWLDFWSTGHHDDRTIVIIY